MVIKYGSWSVDVDSAAFLEKVEFVREHSAAESWRQSPYVTASVAVENGNPVPGSDYVTQRMNISFRRQGAAVDLDAVLIDRGPQYAINSVREAFGLPLMSSLPQIPPKSDPDNPVGAQWPEKGSIVYRFAEGADLSKWPELSRYNGRAGGRNVVFERRRVQTRVGSGPFGVGAEFAPCWIIVG